MVQKLAVAILAFLPHLARADDGNWPDDTLWEKVSEKPTMPYDPRTASPCTEWYNNDGTYDCSSVVSYTMTDLVLFHRWNPSIIHICKNFKKGKSYCLDASDAEPPEAEPSKAETSKAEPPEAEPSIAEPSKAETSKAEPPEAEPSIAEPSKAEPSKADPSKAEPPEAKLPTPTTTLTPTPTPTPNDTSRISRGFQSLSCIMLGIFTPVPAQPGMVNNCNKFYAVGYDDTCASVSSLFAVSLDNFIKWNGGSRQGL